MKRKRYCKPKICFSIWGIQDVICASDNGNDGEWDWEEGATGLKFGE